MKPTLLITLLPLATAADPRSKEDWVGDLEKITKQYNKVVENSLRTDIKPARRHVAYSIPLTGSYHALNKASSFQLTALNPNPAHGSRVDGGSCVSMGEYFSKSVVGAGTDAMSVLLDPGFVCTKDNRKIFRNTHAGIPLTLRGIKHQWEEYTQAYVKNCKEEQGAGLFLIQQFQPLKKKVQQAYDAYQSIEEYCKGQNVEA